MTSFLVSRAARKLRNTAARAEFTGCRWSVDVAGPAASLDWLGPSHDVLTATWPQALHVAQWTPRVAVLVAGLLEAVAKDMTENPDYPSYAWDEATALARAILGPMPIDSPGLS